MKGSRFDLGYCILDDPGEHIFLSVTEGFEHGPGIHRDGVREPWMINPHNIGGNQFTSQGNLQRAGTWTIYHHLKRFNEVLGKKWQILGAQSNGDLTMNPWHVAFVGHSHLHDRQRQVCGLFREEQNREPVKSRWYRCLVKWLPAAAERREHTYEFLDVRPIPGKAGGHATLHVHPTEAVDCAESFNGLPGYDGGDEIGTLVEFALSGKPIIAHQQEISLPNVIDRFQDVRHVFNLPIVPVGGGKSINLGEYQLFNDLNERRAALYCPVVINLELRDHFTIIWNALQKLLIGERHFDLTQHCPTRRGQFRYYPGDTPKIEIFFQPAVYPFGTLGMRPSATPQIVSLSCGGLSGRLGNTLEGVSRMMYDFFRCDDAIILDEGLDVCLVVNPPLSDSPECKDLRYTNEELLHHVWSFVRDRFNEDDEESKKRPDKGYERGAKTYPLNRKLTADIQRAYKKAVDYSDVFRVLPGRSQIRSMLIFAKQIG